MTTAERLAALELRVAENSALLQDIHLAVVGNGSKGSSLRERVSSLESSNNWQHRALYSVFPAMFTALLAQLGLHVSHPGGPS